MSKYIVGLMPSEGEHEKPKTLSQVNDLVDKTGARLMFLAMSDKERDGKLGIFTEEERDTFFVVKINRNQSLIEGDIEQSMYKTIENVENIKNVENMHISVTIMS